MLKYSFSLLFMLAVVFCSPSKVFSAQPITGCLYSGYIYYTPDGSSGGLPNYKKYPQGQRVTTNAAFCKQVIPGNCRIDKKSNQTGTLRTFYLVQCPIDDHVLVLTLLIGGLAFFMLRRVKLQTV